MKNTFILTHSRIVEDSCGFKTDLTETEIIKIIKTWQTKAWYVLDTFRFSPIDIISILESYQCQFYNLSKEEVQKAKIIDLYSIEKREDIIIEESDLVDTFYNRKGTIEFLEILYQKLLYC